MTQVSSLTTIRTGGGPPVVLVHGFTQTSRCWGLIVDDLAQDHLVVAVDAPGHGGSGDVVTSFADGAQLIGGEGGVAVYVGYSMGGRYALRLALDRPDLVSQLVLVSSSPGLREVAQRTTRRDADESLAERMRAIGLENFLDEWLAQPLFRTLLPSDRDLDERRRNTVRGLQSSLRTAGTGAMEPMWDQLRSLSMPVLIVTGALDEKFCAIGAEMAAAIGRNAQHVVVADAGHTVHRERPDTFLSALRTWDPPQAEM